MKKLLSFSVFLFAIFIATESNASHGWLVFFEGSFHGKVVDSTTKKPVEGAVIAVGYRIRTCGPFFVPHCDTDHMGQKETLSDNEGSFLIWPNIFLFPWPFTLGGEDSMITIFKPGYKTIILRSGEIGFSMNIELEPVPETFFARLEEKDVAEHNYAVDKYKSKLLKDVLDAEELKLKSLGKSPDGVIYNNSKDNAYYSIFDIAVDDKNIFASLAPDYNQRELMVLNHEGNRLSTYDFNKQSGDNKHIALALKAPDELASFDHENNCLLEQKFLNRRYFAIKKLNCDKDGFQHRIRRFEIDKSGLIHALVQGSFVITNVTGEKQFEYPGDFFDIALDADRNIYLSNKVGIIKLNASGEKIGEIRLSQMNRMWEMHPIIATDVSGRVYAYTGPEIDVFDGNFKYITSIFAEYPAYGTVHLTRIVVDPQVKHIVAVDSKYARILKYSMAEAGQKPKTLHEAAKRGDMVSIKELVNNGAQINDKNKMGQTALHFAAYYGKAEAATLLLDMGADINIVDRSMDTCLNLAVLNGHIDTVKTLVDRGAELDYSSANYRSPLYVAAEYGQKEIFELLVAKEADKPGFNYYKNFYISPLYIAAEKGHLDILKIMFERNIETGYSKDALLAASSNGHYDIVKYVASSKIDKPTLSEALSRAIQPWLGADTNSNSALTKKRLDNTMKTMKALFDAGADPNVLQNPATDAPLITAAGYADENFVGLLIRHGADVNVKNSYGYTPLYNAAFGGKYASAKILIENGADCNARTSNGETPLHGAAHQGKADVVKLLLDCGSDVNAVNKKGQSPLMVMTFRGGYPGGYSADIAKTLIAKGADVNLIDKNGMDALKFVLSDSRNAQRGPFAVALFNSGAKVELSKKQLDEFLGWAVEENELEAATKLIDLGADINAVNHHNWTQLETAIYNHRLEMARLLFSKGASIRRNMSANLLDSAIQNGSLEMTELLLENGANVNVQGQVTPLHFAVQFNLVDIVRLLLKSGADVNAKEPNLGLTPLHYALKNFKNVEIVEILLKAGADVNAESKYYGTPLRIMVTELSQDKRIRQVAVDLVKKNLSRISEKKSELGLYLLFSVDNDEIKLVSEIIDLMQENRYGIEIEIALIEALKRENIEMAELLISKGAGTNDLSSFFVPAITNDSLKMIGFLIKNGVDINAKLGYDLGTIQPGAYPALPTYGLTPLHLAIVFHKQRIAEYLIETGADVTVKDSAGMKALDYALKNGECKIAKKILKKTPNARPQSECK